MTTLTPAQQQELGRRFQDLATQWNAATRYRSSTRALRDHPVYQQLVALGEPVVPLILRELESEPNVFWFTVLAAITGQNPVPPAVSGRVEAMAQAWIDWGRRGGYSD
jgi:hypothetical protein